MKAKVLLECHDNNRKLNEGDLIFTIQANRENPEGLMVNIDWTFDKATTTEEIKSMLGRFLGNIEDVFGEKMVTEAITHYAQDNNHVVRTPGGFALHFKSKGLDFKDWKKGGENDGF